jgi:hypothetical protein
MGQRAIAWRVAGIMFATLAAVASPLSLGEPVAARTPHGDCLGRVAGIDLQTVTIPQLQSDLERGVVTSGRLVRAYTTGCRELDERSLNG